MKLTRRQEEFIKNLIELSQELDGPIHYSVLAERLGVSPFTAYDMLCLLEEKGMATSEYQLAPDKSGPGRAERLFYPVELPETNHELLKREMAEAMPDEEDKVAFFLERIRNGKDETKARLAEAMLARIPEIGAGDVGYCLEVMTIVSLRLRESSSQQVLMSYFSSLLPAEPEKCRGNLCMLGGFAFGLLAQEETRQKDWEAMLFDHLQEYSNKVTNMSDEDCQQLEAHLLAVFEPAVEEIPVS